VCKEDTLNPNAGRRDGAVIALMYGTALRRQEVVDLTLSDINMPNRTLSILGKGMKYRTEFLQDFCFNCLDNWLRIRGESPGPFFVRVVRSGRIIHHKLHSQTIYMLLKKRQEEAGIPSFTPHDLRRTCITHLLEKGVDIATVARLVGHTKIETTMRYDRRPIIVAHQAAMLLSLY
jgi:integrase